LFTKLRRAERVVAQAGYYFRRVRFSAEVIPLCREAAPSGPFEIALRDGCEANGTKSKPQECATAEANIEPGRAALVAPGDRAKRRADPWKRRLHARQSQEDRGIVEIFGLRSRRRKAEPFRSALSMFTFYINRAGKNLPATRKKTLMRAKDELRKQFALIQGWVVRAFYARLRGLCPFARLNASRRAVRYGCANITGVGCWVS
jgi:hypothetical protein